MHRATAAQAAFLIHVRRHTVRAVLVESMHLLDAAVMCSLLFHDLEQ